MVHVNVNDPRGGYWEYISINQTTMETTLADGSGPIYNMDVILYDARSHTRVMGRATPGALPPSPRCTAHPIHHVWHR